MYPTSICRTAGLYLVLVAATTLGFQTLAAETKEDGVLSLDEALARALQGSPRLAAYGSDIRAADARRIQAGLRPNPELGIEVEEIRFGDSPSSTTVNRAGDGSLIDRSVSTVDNAGFGETQFTLGVSQLIELGGKRARRIELADRDRAVAVWDYEIARAEVILDTRRTYVAIVASQEQVTLRRDLLDLAEAAASAVNALVSAGKVTPLLANRAQVEISQARIELAAAQRELEAARYQLAMLLGTKDPDFVRVSGDLYMPPSVPSIFDLEERVRNSPDLTRWTFELSKREAALALERAHRAPDLTAFMGWRGIGLPDSSSSTFDSSGTLDSTGRQRFDDGLDNSLVLGLSIPIPLFNRNQGNIQEAEVLVDKAAHERREALLTISRILIALHHRMEALRSEVDELERLILPTAAATFDATQRGFEQGKFPYLDVVDTQRTLFEARNQHVAALAALHQAAAEAERFLGEALPTGSTLETGKESQDESQ